MTSLDRADRDDANPDGLESLIWKTALEDDHFRASAIDTRDRLNLLDALARVRKQKDLPQAVVAGWMSTTQSAISEMEKGVAEPRLSTIQRYARFLGFRLRFLLVSEKTAGFYTSRTIHYEARVEPATQKHVAPHESAGKTVTIDNVTHVDFRRREKSPLGGSLVERLKTVSG